MQIDHLKRVIGPVVLATLMATGANAAVPFNISLLPLTPTGLSNQARGLSEDGRVTGYDNLAGGFQRAVNGTSAGTTSAGLPAYTTPVTSTEGHGINSSGLMVGVGRYSAPPPGSTTGSVAYDRGIVFNSVSGNYLAVIEPFNDAGGRRAFAQAINDRNRVVGNGSSDPVLTNQNPRRAFWYDVDASQSLVNYKLEPSRNGLPFLAGGSWSVAYDINETQDIVGFAQTPDNAATPVNRNRAVVWTAGQADANGNPYTTVTRIDTRNTAGTSSLARSINDQGTVVGRMTFSSTFADEAAFVFRAGDPGLTSLGFFGTSRTEAIDIAENGWIVGYAGNTEGDSSPVNRALLWLPTSGGLGGYEALDLNTVIPLGTIATGGWTRLLEARAVNSDGTIVGYGRYVAMPGGPEVTRGFVMTVIPEPSALGLLAPVGLLLMRRRVASI